MTKVGAFYTVYDGTELLSRSIANISTNVDEIIIVWQDISNTGKRSNIVEYICNTMAAKYGCKIYQYRPNLNDNPKLNELNKHQYAIDRLKQLGCTHFIAMACDHFYDVEDFKRSKAEALNYDVTFTHMFTYYKYPTCQITPIEEYVAPFICRLYPETKFIKNNYSGIITDPSVRINTRKTSKLFHVDDIMLHHYSMVRSNMREKLENSASRFSRNVIENLLNEYDNFELHTGQRISYFNNSLTKIVPNYFNLPNPC